MPPEPREPKTLPIHLSLIFIVLLFAGIIIYTKHVTNSRVNQTVQRMPTKFTTFVYQINMEYPSEWQPAPNENYDSYRGEDGFFTLSATGDEKSNIDELARSETGQVLKPYGLTPTVEKTTIDKQTARLIMPSLDQDPSMKGQAELIVKYPKPVVISGQTYSYLVLAADQAHIRQIASSLSFLR